MIQFELPKYKVKTPQTLLEFHVESLVISEENKLKTSSTDTIGILNLLNEICFNKIQDKPKEIETFEGFMNTITLKDREAIIAALYHASYGGEYIVDDICPSCKQLNTSKITLDDIGVVSYYDGKPLEILEKDIEFELPISKAKVSIKVPTIQDEINQFEILEKNEPTYAYTTFLPVKSVTYDNITFTKENNMYDIHAFLSSLPAKDRKFLDKQVNENFGKYGIILPYKVRCSKCQNEFTSYVNFIEQLFRMAFEE